MMLLRDYPEHHGLLPDAGRAQATTAQTESSEGAELMVDPLATPESAEEEAAVSATDWSFEAAAATAAFRVQIATDLVFSLFWAGFNFHAIDVLKSSGLTDRQASHIFIPMGIGVGVSGPLMGASIDRIQLSKLRVLGVAYTLAATGILSLAHALSGGRTLSFGGGLVFGALYGVAAGCVFAVRDIIHADLFGRAALGKISSVGVAVGCAASGLGPFLFGVANAQAHSYSTILWLLGICLLVAAAVLMVVPQPHSAPVAETSALLVGSA